MSAAAPASTVSENERLALHIAVWDDDAERLQALIVAGKHDLEGLDARANTPLLLAYRMGRTKLARMLLAAGAFAKARTPDGFEAVQVAALTANPDIIRESVLAFLAETDAAFERRVPTLQRALLELPDFTMRMSWEFSSWIPLVSRLLPSDVYYISKRGSNLRMDSTLLGMNGLKWERGSISLLLWGAGMPKPGATYVLDNEMKTAADARLAFTHPQDTHIQDWVRKLLTQKQKTTDMWSRDMVLMPVLKQSVFSSFGSALSRMTFGDATPRGRVSDPRSPAGAGAAAAGAAAGAAVVTSATDADGIGDEGGFSADLSSFLAGDTTTGPLSPSPSAASPAAASPAVTPRPLHVDNPRQVTQDVGVWSDCAVYEMRNLCVRDVCHAPVQGELKLASWWKPEYSRQATEEDVRAATDAAKGVGAGAAAAPASAALVDDAPEQRLGPLLRALAAIQAGKINEHNAASATMAELEGVGGAEEGGKRTVVGRTLETHTFEQYFGFERDAAAAGGCGGPSSKASGTVGAFKKEAITVEDKVLDLKVLFSKEFPIAVDKFLPVAEVMARTGRHAENFRAFFDTKFPVGAGFPVRFTIPVFPTITATITFEHCDVRRPPPAAVFDLPADFKMGAYSDRGWIRQL